MAVSPRLEEKFMCPGLLYPRSILEILQGTGMKKCFHFGKAEIRTEHKKRKC